MIAVSEQAFAPKDVSVVATTWTELLPANKQRVSWKLVNTDSTNPGRYLTPLNNPLVLVCAGAEFVNVDAVVPDMLRETSGGFFALITPPAVGPGDKTIFSISDGSSAGNYVRVWVDANNLLRAEMQIGGVVQWDMVHPTNLLDTDYHAVEFFHTGEVPVLKIDGVPQKSLNTITNKAAWINSVQSIDTARIGSLSNGGPDSDQYSGNIDHISFYNFYDGANKQIVGEYRIDEVSATITDYSGNGYNGTLTGALTQIQGKSIGSFIIQEGFEIENDPSVAARSLWGYSDNAITFNVTEFYQ